MSEIVVDMRLQTGEHELPQGADHVVITATGPLPELALAELEATARERGADIAGSWTALPPRRGADGTPTADFILFGVRLVPGQVSIAGLGAELEMGWLAYGTLAAASGRLRWDDEPR